YHLWIEGNVSTPVIRHRDPLFARDLTSRPERRVISGTFNLGRQVGVLPFTIAFADRHLDIELEVVPTKIDYATDYENLISEVAAGARGLALEYMRSTHRYGDRSNRQTTEIEWLSSLRQQIGELQKAFAHINQRPFRHLLREVHPTANHKIRRLDSVARRAILRGKGSGIVDEVAGLGPIRRVIDSVTAVSTLDTPEHCWLRLQTGLVLQQLRSLQAALGMEARKTQREVSERRKAEQSEVGELADSVGSMLQMEFLRLATSPPRQTSPSLTMLGAHGYRDAYRILSGLRLGLAVSGSALELQTKDIHELYELWCYLTVVELVSVYTDTERDAAQLVQSHKGTLRVDLRAGRESEIPLHGNERSFHIAYNRGFAGETGEQKPDIVIRVEERNRPDIIIVLDAKYRVDATDQYRQKYGAPGPPIDAINALHRYRDAIVINQDNRYRPVVRGVALFPLTKEETEQFVATSKLSRSLASLGIGALPFLPGNTALVSEWIEWLLQLPAEDLAWNGLTGPVMKASSSR
ncbi:MULTISPECIES: DUF2357 domain-containing protein, partial [unclassified Sphingopyxis]|uniref:DUF2357 domain-containing protein n=1 Tax=unclassified Sphingopyxis TaxID=2614943 RepID=UPI0024ADA140